MRTGSAWDALAVVALVLPLAGLAAPLTGRNGRLAVVPAGRRGALLGALVWVAIVVAEAAPDLGGFTPAPATVAASAGTLLVAAGLAWRRPGDGIDEAAGPPPVAAALGPVAAAVVVLVLGLVDGPVAPSTGAATAWVLVGASVAALAGALTAADAGRGGAVALTSLLAPAGLLVAVRAAPSLPGDPSEVAGLAAAAVAAGLGSAIAWRPDRARFQASTAAVLVAAVGLSPVAGARPAVALVAAGAALVAVSTGPWRSLALAPGLGVAAAAAADVPAAGVGAPVHLAWATLALLGVVGVVAAARPFRAALAPPPSPAPPAEVVVALAVLTAWLVVAPGSWRWAVPDPAPLQAWDRAAAVAAAAAATVVVLRAAVDWWPGRATTSGPDGVSRGLAR